jgi:hypothetical protein
MELLMNRDYHEAIQFLDPEISKQIRLGNELLKKIPFPETESVTEEEETYGGLTKRDIKF